MDLKTEILSSCSCCDKSGLLPDGNLCACVLKFRAMNRMVDSGFNLNTLKLVSDQYIPPEIESGDNFLDYYAKNPPLVEQGGLSLYIYSREKGRGKTTLAHWLVYGAARHFALTARYKRDRSYGFDRVDKFLSKDKGELWKSTFYVLDDMGAEDSSADWIRQKTLSEFQDLLHFRRDKKLPMIITSNYKPSDLSALYRGVLDSLLEIAPDGSLGGSLFRCIEVGGGEDLRVSREGSAWPV